MSSVQGKSGGVVVAQGLVYALTVVATLGLIALVMAQPFTANYRSLATVAGLMSYLGFRRLDLLQPWQPGKRGSIANQVLWTWAMIVSALLLFGYLIGDFEEFSRRVLLLWFVLTPVSLCLLHWTARALVWQFLPALSHARSSVIVYSNHTARLLAGNLARSGRYDVVGYFEDREPERITVSIDGVPFLGRTSEVVPYVREHDIEVVFIVLPDHARTRAGLLFEELGDTTASVYYVPDLFLFSEHRTQLTEIEGLPAVEVAETPFYGADGMLKRLFDIVFATAALIGLAPVMLGLALAVKLSSPGPVFFKQKRYGLNGREYSVYKFRSMVVGDDLMRQQQQATQDDPRVTRVGRFIRKTSLDELPQFYNVLRGDMSVVGPRPHSVAHNEQYRKAIKRYMVRHKVKPGLTGWAQVHGLRGETAQLERMEERIQYDLEYIRRWSPLLDLRIILMTIALVSGQKNAY